MVPSCAGVFPEDFVGGDFAVGVHVVVDFCDFGAGGGVVMGAVAVVVGARAVVAASWFCEAA